VTLIHILEKSPPQKIHGETHLQNFFEAEEYLENISKNNFHPEIPVKYHVHIEKNLSVVKALAVHETELNSDLIIMTTHGFGGLKDIFYGNNAEQIINKTAMPVLFIPSVKNNKFTHFSLKKIMVPVDGTEKHELGLNIGVEIASKTDAELLIPLVIPTRNTLSLKNASVGIMLPGTTKEILGIFQDDAQKYISDLKNMIENLGIKVSTEIKSGNPAKEISSLAQEKNINLIVLGTHGKAGLKAFWSESIGAQITNRTNIAILFIPIQN